MKHVYSRSFRTRLWFFCAREPRLSTWEARYGFPLLKRNGDEMFQDSILEGLNSIYQTLD